MSEKEYPTCPYCGERHHPGICCPAYQEISKSPYVKAQQSTIQRLEREVERLTKDKERLDWLDKQQVAPVFNGAGNWQIDVRGESMSGYTLHEVIDKAITTHLKAKV